MREQYLLYEQLKRQWVREHPGSTPKEYDRAIREIADRCGI